METLQLALGKGGDLVYQVLLSKLHSKEPLSSFFLPENKGKGGRLGCIAARDLPGST